MQKSFSQIQTIVITVIASIFFFCIGYLCGFKITAAEDNKVIDIYNSYSIATEELLDTLNNEYNWVDAIDSPQYYDSKEKLDSIICD